MRFYLQTTPLLLLFMLFTPCFVTAAEHRNYSVQPGDSLFALAMENECSVDEIKTLNHLTRETLYSGENILLPLKHPDSHRVQPGETLSGIALKYGIPQEKLISLNKLKSPQLISGQKLALIRPPYEGEKWTVRQGDSLSWISLKFNISVERLMQINLMENPALKVGQNLNLTPPRPQIVQIQKGDSLWKLSSHYNIGLEDLKKWNHLKSDRVLVGMKIQLYPVVLNTEEEMELTPLPDSGQNPEAEVKLAQVQTTSPFLYFSSPTDRLTQPDRNYSETDLENPAVNYSKASKLLKDFEKAASSLPPLGGSLKGYTVVLDPGHGGLDPGAIVASSDGNGNTVYVVEDEYAYDISLRVYRDLIRHGAEVHLTVISPNQTIRTTRDASITFVNEKNEVYNSSSLNSEESGSVWPVGSAWGLDERKKIAARFLKGKSRSHTIYVSIHADNNPGDGKGTGILYHPNEEGKSSEELARHLMSCMGAGSHVRSQELRVLDGNPAGAAVLIEVRNLAYKSNAWAIRNEELRQDDADRIVKGIVNYFH